MARPRSSNTIRAVHKRINTDRGPAWKKKCSCGLPADEWAYQYNGDPELVSPTGAKYSTDIWKCYEAMCVWCHKQFDFKMDPDRYLVRRRKAAERMTKMNKEKYK